MGKKVVVTGATSFIGIHLIKEWLKKDVDIVAVVRPNSKNVGRIPLTEQIHILECNMTGYDMLVQEIGQADYFYHLAWEGTRVPYRDDETLQKTNYECALKAMHAAQNLKCSFFLGAGSQAEYGSIDGIIDESCPCVPGTAYGKEKLHACGDLMSLAEQKGIKFIWTRIFSLYGEYDYPGTLVMSAVKKMMMWEDISMTAGTQLWDYLHVEDAARAMVLFAIQKSPNGIYNIASGIHKPLREFVILMKEILGSKSRLNFGAIPYGSNAPVNLTPSVDKLKNTLGWYPEITFEEGIKRMSMDKYLLGGRVSRDDR